jgi:hypothetical protein
MMHGDSDSSNAYKYKLFSLSYMPPIQSQNQIGNITDAQENRGNTQ